MCRVRQASPTASTSMNALMITEAVANLSAKHSTDFTQQLAHAGRRRATSAYPLLVADEEHV